MSTSFGPKIIIPNLYFYLDPMNKKCYNRTDQELIELIGGDKFNMIEDNLFIERFSINKNPLVFDNDSISTSDGTIEFVLYFQSLPTELVGTECIYNTDNLIILIKEGDKGNYAIEAKNTYVSLFTIDLPIECYRRNIHYSLSFENDALYYVYVNGVFQNYTEGSNSGHSASKHLIGGDFYIKFLLTHIGINIFRIYNKPLSREQINKNFNSIKKRSYLNFDYNKK